MPNDAKVIAAEIAETDAPLVAAAKLLGDVIASCRDDAPHRAR